MTGLDQIAADFLDAMIRRMLIDEGNSLGAKFVARESRKRFDRDRTTIAAPLLEALDKNNRILAPKGNLMAQTHDELCCEIRAMLPGQGEAFGVGFSWWSIIKKVLALLNLLIPDEQPAPMAVGAHEIAHIDDPFTAVMVAIDSTKGTADRVCAGADLLHFGGKTFLPHGH